MRELYSDPNHPLPRPIILGGAALMIGTVMLAAAARATGVGITTSPDPVAVESRDLVFSEGSDETLDVVEAESGREIARMAAEEGGFVRATMRALIRNRTRHGEPAIGAFRVTLAQDGGVWLQDLGTNQNIDLRAFGPNQVRAFAAFLPNPGEASR